MCFFQKHKATTNEMDYSLLLKSKYSAKIPFKVNLLLQLDCDIDIKKHSQVLT